MNEVKNIAIFQNDLKVGGIQKSLINLLNNIDLNKYNIDLYLFEKEQFFLDQVPKQVNILHLPKMHFWNRLVYFRVLKIFGSKYKINKKYDVTIDFNSYLNESALGTILTESDKKVMFIHNDVEFKLKEERKYKMLWHFFKGKFKYYDEFVAVSLGVVDSFRRKTKIYDKKISVIPNFIDSEQIIKLSDDPVDIIIDESTLNLISVGRLCHQKGFDILLNDISRVIKARGKVKLYIVGDGPDREKLSKLIKSHNLENNVFLLGNQQNPFKYMRKMDCFVLTSRYEGQGMVFLEAKVLGLDIIMPKHLEKYNEDIYGVNSIVDAIINHKKNTKKIFDRLEDYNRKIIENLDILFNNTKSEDIVDEKTF